MTHSLGVQPGTAFVVAGSARLAGTVAVAGAKNSALKLMAAALLAEGTSVLSAVPDIADVAIMAELLRRLGCDVAQADGSMSITVPEKPDTEADYDLVRRLRASISVLGPLVARRGEARVALPGGDAIGSRGLDLHIAGLTQLGVTIRNEHGYLIASAPYLTGAVVWLDFPSVGATENVLMAAVLARGTTVIDNAAQEPEIVDIAEMLSAMGARISGAGTPTITVEGVDSLRPAAHRTVADRIVAGTLAIGAAMTCGDVRITGARADHLLAPLDKLRRAGAEVVLTGDGFRVRAGEPIRAVDVVTLPYPGFPTDLQPAIIAMTAVAQGSAMVTENIFDGRFSFVDELVRLGADIRTDGHHALIRGQPRLSGAPVRATDIRAGAALVLAGLVADGVTTVHDIHHVDRGYPDFVGTLRALGADVSRMPG